MNVVIYAPPSAGCETSAQILGSVLQAQVEAQGGKLSRMTFPHMMGVDAMAALPGDVGEVDCAFFVERVVDHPALTKARCRIFLPNPEWLDPATAVLARRCTHIWHKSRFSLERLRPLFPDAQHIYVGFTSQDPGRRVTTHESFVHLRGKLFTNRNTDSIFAAWKAHAGWPDLHVHFYSQKKGGIDYPGSLRDGNIHVRMGWLERRPYLDLAASHGIHLCTSEVEGFGHYINEARAMGALVVTVDGGPMNELIDENCGMLVAPSHTSPMNKGTRYHIDADGLAVAIDRILRLSLKDRRALGDAARSRFLDERRLFVERVRTEFAVLRP